MTVFDLEKGEQGDWFPFFGSNFDPATGEIIYEKPEDGAAEFRIRGMGRFFEERQKDRKKEYKMVLNPSTRAMERVGWFEDLPPAEAKKESDDAWDYAITGMKDAFSGPGVAMECTMENKLKLLRMPVFLRYIQKVFQILSDAGIKRAEAVEKNSPAG